MVQRASDRGNGSWVRRLVWTKTSPTILSSLFDTNSYTNVIVTPMDLSTIRKKLYRLQYKTLDEFKVKLRSCADEEEEEEREDGVLIMMIMMMMDWMTKALLLVTFIYTDCVHLTSCFVRTNTMPVLQRSMTSIWCGETPKTTMGKVRLHTRLPIVCRCGTQSCNSTCLCAPIPSLFLFS
jgi:hypothetical protein